MTTSPPAESAPTRVLLVDDDPVSLRTLTRLLQSSDRELATAASGEEALERCRTQAFDVVVSDIHMPGMSGLDFLRAVRTHDLDVQVVLLTGSGSVHTAVDALGLGVFRYLTKPADTAELRRTVTQAAAATKVARLTRESLVTRHAVGDHAALEAAFASALKNLWIAYQPIVRYSTREVLAYEALMRSSEPALPHPGAILDAAERLGRLRDLGREVRRLTAESFRAAPAGTRLFMNLHTSDLEDETLLTGQGPVGALAGRVTLEVTERASLEGLGDVRPRVGRLRQLGFCIALDDIGAGYSGLSSFVALEPDVVKIDMSLVRGVEQAPVKQRLIRSVLAMCEGLQVVAEGVETEAELQALRDLGCDVFQGYHFARPDRGFPVPRF